MPAKKGTKKSVAKPPPDLPEEFIEDAFEEEVFDDSGKLAEAFNEKIREQYKKQESRSTKDPQLEDLLMPVEPPIQQSTVSSAPSEA